MPIAFSVLFLASLVLGGPRGAREFAVTAYADAFAAGDDELAGSIAVLAAAASGVDVEL